MASNSTFQVAFKITDAGNGMKTLTIGAESLKEVLSATVEEAEDEATDTTPVG